MSERRLSPRLGVHAGFAVAFLLLAAASGRPEPVALAVPFAVAVLTGLAAVREPRFEVEREVAGLRVFEGDETQVTVTVRALDDVPLLEVAGPMPEGAVLAGGAAARLVSLRQGEVRRLSYSFRMPWRSVFELGPARARAHDASASASWEAEAGEWVAGVVYPAPPPMRPRLRPPRTRSSVGSYVSRAAGEGFDFLDLRGFAPGDQTRRVNWRATARRGELVVNQFAAERNADVVLVMDVLSEAGDPGSSVLDRSARAAAALAQHFLRDKNRVGYVELGHYVHWLTPSSGRRQWHRILGLLAQLEVRERHVTFELDSLPAKLLPPGAFVVGFSALANPLWYRAAVQLVRRGHDVAVVVPWGPAAVKSSMARTPEAELALRIWELEQRTAVDELRRAGLVCVPWLPNEPFDQVVQAVARAGRRVRG